MTRRALFGVLAAPLLPATVITTELPDWVRVPRDECLTCGVNPKGAEGTIYCAECLAYWRVERVRLQPAKGDVVLGPDGARVEVTNVLECGDNTVIRAGTLIWFTRTVPGRGSQERVVWAHHWAELDGWDAARLG